MHSDMGEDNYKKLKELEEDIKNAIEDFITYMNENPSDNEVFVNIGSNKKNISQDADTIVGKTQISEVPTSAMADRLDRVSYSRLQQLQNNVEKRSRNQIKNDPNDQENTYDSDSNGKNSKNKINEKNDKFKKVMEKIYNHMKTVRSFDPPRTTYDLKRFIKEAYWEWRENNYKNLYFHEYITEEKNINKLFIELINMIKDENTKRQVLESIKNISFRKGIDLTIYDLKGNNCIGKLFKDNNYNYFDFDIDNDSLVEKINELDYFEVLPEVIDGKKKYRFNLKGGPFSARSSKLPKHEHFRVGIINKIIEMNADIFFERAANPERIIKEFLAGQDKIEYGVKEIDEEIKEYIPKEVEYVGNIFKSLPANMEEIHKLINYLLSKYAMYNTILNGFGSYEPGALQIHFDSIGDNFSVDDDTKKSIINTSDDILRHIANAASMYNNRNQILHNINELFEILKTVSNNNLYEYKNITGKLAKIFENGYEKKKYYILHEATMRFIVSIKNYIIENTYRDNIYTIIYDAILSYSNTIIQINEEIYNYKGSEKVIRFDKNENDNDDDGEVEVLLGGSVLNEKKNLFVDIGRVIVEYNILKKTNNDLNNDDYFDFKMQCITNALYYNDTMLFEEFMNICKIDITHNNNIEFKNLDSYLKKISGTKYDIISSSASIGYTDESILNVETKKNNTSQDNTTKSKYIKKRKKLPQESQSLIINALRMISGGGALCLNDDESIVAHARLKEMHFSGGVGTLDLPHCTTFDIKNAESSKLKRVVDAQLKYIKNNGMEIDDNFIKEINELLKKLAMYECELSKHLDDLSYLMKNVCDGNIPSNINLSEQKDLYAKNKKKYISTSEKIYTTIATQIAKVLEDIAINQERIRQEEIASKKSDNEDAGEEY